MTTLPTNWTDDIGMTVDASFLNDVGTTVNTNTTGLTAIRGAASAYVATSEQTASTSYVDLTTTTDTVTVTVPASGKVILVASANAAYVTGVNGDATVSVALSGATTQAASDSLSARAGTFLLITRVLSGLTPGPTTFKMKYKSFSTGGSPTYAYSNRSLLVVPLP